MKKKSVSPTTINVLYMKALLTVRSTLENAKNPPTVKMQTKNREYKSHSLVTHGIPINIKWKNNCCGKSLALSVA